MRIGLLGAVEAWRGTTGGGDAGQVPLGGVRLRGLLARLALDAGHPVGTAVLFDDLWGEAPPGAGNALQALVSRLRRTIGADLVATDTGGYRLRVEPGAVDALQFGVLAGAGATAAARGDAAEAHALLQQALALWRGPALADIGDLPFVAAAAARLTERRAVAVEDSARLALTLGTPDGELDALTAQLAATPLRESTAALLARGLHAAGRQADALAVLDRTIAQLAGELGVDPGPELVEARMSVLRGESATVRQAPTAPPPRPVAGGLNSFVGRAPDVERVRTLLTDARLVTLIGPGGAGKTRLAREAVDGAATAEERRRGVAVAELAALTDADQLPAAVLAAVGEPEMVLRAQDDSVPDTTARLLAAVADRPTLLVLDNCEHLVDAVAAMADTLLQASPRLRVLATSREPLGVPGEVLHPVDALPEHHAMHLFADRAAAVRPGFTLAPDVAPAVADICRRLDGQPLPIELAAARMRTLTPAEIADRLDDRFRLLTTGARTALPRHQTLRAVVDWSWDLLAEPERAVARRLGVFAGGATAAAAEQVCSGPSGPAPEDVFALLAALVDKSLVVAVPQPDGGPTRYRMLETIREYAGERLTDAGERDAAVAAHARVMLELAETAEPHLRSAEQLTWLAGLRAEADEIDMALRRVVAAGDADTAHRLVAAMVWSWLIRGLTGEATRWVEAVALLDGPAPPAARAINATYLAVVTVATGDTESATRHAETAIALSAEAPMPRHPLMDLLSPVFTLFSTEDTAPVRRLVETAEDPWVRAFALHMLSQIAENEGEIDEQRRHARAAHQLFTTVGDRFGLGNVVHALGELEDITGQYDAAAAAYDEAITLARELGNDEDRPQFMMRRALLEARRGDLDAARAALHAVSGEVVDGPFGGMGDLAIALAQVERMAGNFDEARSHLQVAVAGFSTAGLALPQRRAYLEMSRAAVEIASGETAAGQTMLRDAVAAAVESRDGPIRSMVAEVAAQLAFADGDAECAALLLGVAAAQRGTIDRGAPETLELLQRLHCSLGQAADDIQRRGRELPKDEGLARLTAFVERGAPEPAGVTGGREVPPSAGPGSR